MTEWQWQVILALCRIVLRNFNNIDITNDSDVQIIKDAVLREIT